jgi:ABC-type lipoprotein release transport system permease subunit
VVLSRRVASALGVGVGDTLKVRALEMAQPLPLTVSGLYEISDPLSPYWASSPASGGATTQPLDEAAYVAEAGLLAGAPQRVDLQYQVILDASAFYDSGAPLLAQIAAATNVLRSQSLGIDTTADQLVAQIQRDQSLVSTGVDLAAAQLILLCWFALYLAVRYTSDTRRGDIGLLKLRGAATWRVWSLIASQSGAPMIAGAAVGLALGRLAAIGLAGSVSGAGGLRALITALAVAAGIGLGALVVCVAAETRALRAPVSTLIRRVPSRRSGWRAELGDLLIVVLAIAGVYQGYADLQSGGSPSILSLLAPGLVGLAVAVVAARALPLLAAGGATAALSSGRPGLALAALHVARRPGTQRVFAVIAVSVSVLSTTLFFWQTANDAWGRRAVAELGAARVLTVRADNSATLLAGVRAADPSGRYAMAVVRGTAVTAADRVLAVDTSRLAAVAQFPTELGLPDPATLARELHPTTTAPPTLTDGSVTLTASLSTVSGAEIPVTMDLVSPTGAWVTVAFGPLSPGTRTYPATITGCRSGCRLAAFEVDPHQPGVTVTLNGLDQAADEVVSAAAFGDIARWRPPTGPNLVGPAIGTDSTGLSVSVYSGGRASNDKSDMRVFFAAAPAPLPVALVGDITDSTSRPGDARLIVLGAEPVSYSVVATVTLLPRLGTSGALMDLQYAQLSNSGPNESAGFEVWLTADAPPSVVDALGRHGIQVVGQDSVASITDRLRQQGPGAALRFDLFAAVVLLLVGAGTIVVSSTVERRPRAEELAALRAQGLSARVARRVVYTGTGVMAVGAIVVGALAALLAQEVVAAALPVFSDSWSLLPVRRGPWAAQLGLAVAAAVVVLGGAALLSAARTVRSIPGGDP